MAKVLQRARQQAQGPLFVAVGGRMPSAARMDATRLQGVKFYVHEFKEHADDGAVEMVIGSDFLRLELMWVRGARRTSDLKVVGHVHCVPHNVALRDVTGTFRPDTGELRLDAASDLPFWLGLHLVA